MKAENIFFRIKRKSKLIYGRLVRFFVNMFPRNPKLVVYGGSLDLFIDNEKHLFIYNNQNIYMNGYKQVWLTRNDNTFATISNLGLHVLKANSIKGIWTILRAGVIVYDNEISDFSQFNLSEGAKRIELWHGIPSKMFGYIKYDNQPAYQAKAFFYEKYLREHIYGDYVICTSSNQKRLFSASFKIPEDRVIVATYPRLRPLLMKEEERREYLYRYESLELVAQYDELQKSPLRKIIYMPTFRDGNPRYLDDAIPDWTLLNDVCKSSGCTFYLKVHRVAITPSVEHLSNIHILDNSIDIYPLLPNFDLLITDYSSILYDFSLLKKHVILYTYDLDGYVSSSRKVYKQFLDLRDKIGHTDSFDCLLQAISKNTLSNDFPIDDYFDSPNDLEAINKVIRGQV